MPRYYERDAHGIPVAWVDLMRRSMASTLWRFSTTRMLHDYVEQMYLPNAVGAARGDAVGRRAAQGGRQPPHDLGQVDRGLIRTRRPEPSTS